jgi:hypothetical protein
MNFRHIVMTRFNLATPGREAAIRNNPGWLDRRFDLFERYCLPTMAAQNCQDFEWIIYFDVGTPEPIRQRIEAARRVRKFHPYFTGLFHSDGWRNSAFELLGEERPERLLTTNLDNDDGLAVDFVSRLHAAAQARTSDAPAALNFTNGYVLNGPKLYAHDHRSNAFVNLLETLAENVRTAPAIPHMELDRYVEVVQLPGPGAWLQVVHGENVSNKIRGNRVGRAVAEERFPAGVISAVRDPSTAELLKDSLVTGPLRSGRDRLINGVRSLLR